MFRRFSYLVVPGVSSLDYRNGKVSFQIDGRIFARLKIGSGWQDIKDDMERMRRPNEDGKVEDPWLSLRGVHLPRLSLLPDDVLRPFAQTEHGWRLQKQLICWILEVSQASIRMYLQTYWCGYFFFAPNDYSLIQYLKHVWSIFHHPGYSYHVPPFSCPTPFPTGQHVPDLALFLMTSSTPHVHWASKMM